VTSTARSDTLLEKDREEGTEKEEETEEKRHGGSERR